MNSHFQSSETPWIASGFDADGSGAAGSRSCEPIHATPPSRMITITGIAQMISSNCPE